MRSGLRIARAMPCGPRTCPRLPQAKSWRISSCSPAARRRTMAGGSTVVWSDRYRRRRALRAPCLYIVMELVDGKPLNELIPRKGMRLTEALRIAAQVADDLTAAHGAGIVHRDLKPANIHGGCARPREGAGLRPGETVRARRRRRCGRRRNDALPGCGTGGQ